VCAWRDARTLAQARPQASGSCWCCCCCCSLLLVLLNSVSECTHSSRAFAHHVRCCTCVCVCVGHAKAECVWLLRRLHRRLACYWPAAGRCRAVGSPRSAGGTWLAAHFAGANNSNHPHSAAPFGKGPTIWEGAPGRFGEGPWADAGKCDERLQTRAATGGSRRQLAAAGRARCSRHHHGHRHRRRSRSRNRSHRR
jgi:hypothetical protein